MPSTLQHRIWPMVGTCLFFVVGLFSGPRVSCLGTFEAWRVQRYALQPGGPRRASVANVPQMKCDIEAKPELRTGWTAGVKGKRIVEHAYAPFSGPAWSVAAAVLGWDEERARHMVTFGGFYRREAFAQENAKARRLLDPDVRVEQGEYVRVHPNPRRFLEVEGIDWESRVRKILSKHRDALTAINDAMRQPVFGLRKAERRNGWRARDGRGEGEERRMGHGDEDSPPPPLALRKRYRALVQVLPGFPPLTPGELTHFLKPTPWAPKEYQREPPHGTPLATPQVVPDLLDPAGNLGDSDMGGNVNKAWGKMALEEPPPEAWRESRLVLRSVRWVTAPRRPGAKSALEAAALYRRGAVSVGGHGLSGEEDRFQEVEVELITGRPHQIRGQLSAEGCPVFGDELYGGGPFPRNGSGADNPESSAAIGGSRLADASSTPGNFVASPNLALQAFSVELKLGGKLLTAELPRESLWWVAEGAQLRDEDVK
ncbi:unnamed protein product [Discosporangium mesarthrocarpum]